MNLFQWLAGADQKILDQCSDSEKNKITGLGTLVLIPAVIGIFSMTYAVSTITNKEWLYYFVGVIWFFIVLFIDRYIVSTLYKSKLNDKSNFVWAVIARYLFALFVGIAVAHPMTLLWFNESISQGIKDENKMKMDNSEVGFLNNQNTIRAGVLELEKRKECLEKLYTAEQSGNKVELECGYSSGLAGNSKRCEEIKKQIDTLSRNIATEEERIREFLSMNRNQRDNDSIFISNNVSFDYLARVRMLSKLENDKTNGGSHIWLVKVFIILFFIFIDILPITMKVATSYGEYEAIRDSTIHKTVKMQEADRQAIDQYASIYTTISVAKLNNEAKMGEVSNLFSSFNNVMREIDEERKKSHEIISNIRKDISAIKDEKIKGTYDVYFSFILEMFNKTISKGQQKFLDYLKSV